MHDSFIELIGDFLGTANGKIVKIVCVFVGLNIISMSILFKKRITNVHISIVLFMLCLLILSGMVFYGADLIIRHLIN